MIFSNISPAALDLHALSSPPKEMALRALGGQSGISLARRTASSLVLPGDVPSDWLRISEMAKEVVGWPAWPEADPPPSGARIVTRRNELHTAAGSTISVVIPLGESGGPGLEAVRLRLAAWPFRREYDVTATLEVEGGRTFVTIARVDGWPPDRSSSRGASSFATCNRGASCTPVYGQCSAWPGRFRPYGQPPHCCADCGQATKL
jgi:hypothetical protein